MRQILAQETVNQIAIGGARIAILLQNHRNASVGGLQNSLRFGNDAQQRNTENFEHIINAEHIAAARTIRRIAGQYQMFLDRFVTVLGARMNQNLIILNRAEYRVASDPSPETIKAAEAVVAENAKMLEDRLAKSRDGADPADLVDLKGGRDAKAEHAVDKLREKFGPDAVVRGRALSKD